ncbi:hypothetical protein DPMN_035691 [Dreissena polymorpha]|uniref:FAD dependent oxidoreductase domain-containing protein n=1 Tax=Dreissena polymorpha TaxID=45954 RepID=A0A9D4RN76_DREPO|nr:hypothetical protein DPMN_035691 [Dreissena polymorpha]
MNALEVDVIVIGAGISGLTAAHTLLKKDPGLDVLVLEAKGTCMHAVHGSLKLLGLVIGSRYWIKIKKIQQL